MPDPTTAPNESSANPADGAWKSSFGAENAAALESFKTPADFYKSYSDTSTELKTLKEKTPSDWRKEAAGEDEKVAKMLERFSTAKDFGKAYVEAQAKIRSGDFAKPLAKDANEQERTAWRQANGIPEKPEGYFDKLPDGLVIGKDDQPLFTDFAKVMHDQNVPPAAVQGVVKWYYDLQDKQQAEVANADKQHAREATDALREKFGNDYRANMGQVSSLLDGLGGELKNQFMDATLPDGRRLFNSPDFISWLADKAREINPAGVLIPASGGDQIKSIETELATLKGKMANKASDYWKGPTAEKQQERYRQLLDAQQKLKSRAA
jgi:hypothetical protein